MGANSKSISLALAATLLLEIAATCSCANPTYQFLFGDERPTIVWMAKPTCGEWEKGLLDGSVYTDNPPDMLAMLSKELSGEAKTDEEYLHKWNARTLIAYSFKSNCNINLEEFINLYTGCDGQPEFNNYAKFVRYYGQFKLQFCAGKIIKELNGKENEIFERDIDKLNRFFKAALAIKEVLEDEDMYHRVKEVDLTRRDEKLDVRAMFKVADEHRKCAKHGDKTGHLLNIFSDFCNNFEIEIRYHANIVNVTRGIGMIRESSLLSRFLLVNEYLRLCAQIGHEETRASIEINWRHMYAAKQ